ncbi:Gigaxonin Kelch-like protein 16 [Collichthys lucidus]|uniref:Gigaxonin Kelch-like protein 16 n=1 Tax=Collichthys lucidus TaxID=240159 RepID=A0A4U5UHY9_COLLU|nr:Gigaxonin Kelch-like protein 16 [Collichthys lucidus]
MHVTPVVNVHRVSDPQHSQKLLRVLRVFWQEQSFHDALLVVDGEELPVQKNILAAASPYIRTKLNYNPPKEDGSTYRIELQGVSMSIMKQILDYIFSGEFLESCITAENCIGIRLFSLHYCLYHVHYVATEFLQTHFSDVAVSEEFRELPPDRLCEVLSMEKLNVGNEKRVLEAVVRWFAHDPEDRRVGPCSLQVECEDKRGTHEGSDVRCVAAGPGPQLPERAGRRTSRFHCMLCGIISSSNNMVSHQAMGEPLMREVIREHCQKVLGEGTLQGEALLAAFKPRGYSECIVVAGGEDRKSRKPTAVTRCMCPLYDTNRQAWIELQPMSVARLGHGMVAAEGFLFVMGGTDEHNTVLDSGEKYDPESNTWSPIPPMLQVGCYAAMNKRIYAMGGGSYGKLFDSVECFDPKTQHWTGLCPLKERRFGSVACGVGQELYVFGGVRSQEQENAEQRQMLTCKSEFYHDEMRRWMLLDDQNLCIQTSSSFVYGAVPIGASIYVVGDLDTGTSFDYIREFRRSTGTWHRTKPMLPSDLSKTSCAALRIANCRLFRLQLSQGMFRIRV